MKTKYLILLSLALLFSACGSKKPSFPLQLSQQPTTYSNTVVYEDSQPIQMMLARKMAMTANIDVDVDDIKKAEQEIETVVQKFNGHIENVRLSENGYYYANIKVPSDKLLTTLDAIAMLGDKTSQSINKRDLTDGFVNSEERLKNLKLFRKKMKKLLDRTSKIEEILRIEKELNRVQTEIDMIERQLKNMQGSVEMSPIDISLKEKTIYGPIGYVGNGLWWAVKKLFIIR